MTSFKLNIRRGLVYLGIALVVFWACNKQIKSTPSRGDIDTYLNASRLLLNGENPYTSPNRGGSDYYVYPPLLATLLIPLTAAPITLAIYLWCIAKVLMVAWMVRTIYRGLSGVSYSSLSPKNKWIFGFVPLLLSGRFVLHDLSYGQVHIVVVALAVLGLQLALRDQSLRGGASIGISAVLKLVTIPLVIWFALRRQGKVLIGILAGSIAGLLAPALVVGFDKNLAYLEFWFRNMILSDAGRNTYWPLRINWSLYALMLRFFSIPAGSDQSVRGLNLTIFQLPAGFLRILPLVIMFAVVGLLAWSAWKLRGQSCRVAIWSGAALAFSAMPIFSPIALEHHYTVLLPAYSYVVYVWHGLKLEDRWFKALVISSSVLNTLTAELFVGNHLRDLFLELGCLTWGALLLLIAILRSGICLNASRQDSRPAGATVLAATQN